jgi:hypothetical protein
MEGSVDDAAHNEIDGDHCGIAPLRRRSGETCAERCATLGSKRWRGAAQCSNDASGINCESCDFSTRKATRCRRRPALQLLSPKIGAGAGSNEKEMICGESAGAGEGAAISAASPLADRTKGSDPSAALAVSFTKMRRVELITKDWGDQDSRLGGSALGCDDDPHLILLAPVTPTAY